MEEWKDITGYPRYMVSNTGKVWSKYLKRTLKTEVSHRGYVRCMLTNGGDSKIKVSVHRLVADHFIPNPENKPTVNHKNKDKLNNHIYNLEWCTYPEQIQHRDNKIKNIPTV